VREQAVRFSAGQALLGILSLPAALDPGRPVVLIPNSGQEHRVGPGRLHVQLARALAHAGIATLRFDLAGLGDSGTVSGRARSDSAADIVAAMNTLSARGFPDRFVGAGFVGGAHHIHQLARTDSRIVGAIFLDGYTYKTPRYWVNYGVDRLTQSRRFASIAEREGDESAQDGAANPAEPPATQMKADLQDFILRNVALCYLFTGDLQADYNYREQLTDAFPFLRSYPRLTLRYLPEADHSFCRRSQREELIRLLVDWVLHGPQSLKVAPSGIHH
jgi:hypothetical protein